MEKQQKIALSLNIVIFIFALVGSIMCFWGIVWSATTHLADGIEHIKFFTVQSNVFAGIVALIYILFLLRQNKTQKVVPTWVSVLKLMATIDLLVTFLVVALFLGFIAEDGYFSMFTNANLFFHLLIPILNFVSFTFFEKPQGLKFCHTFVGLVHFALYGVFYLIVVLTHYHDGTVPLEYDWYAFAQMGLLVAFGCAVVLFGMAYLISFLLYKHSKKQKS